ncbi:MAG TPA: hypothetical protein QF651_10365, partial [Acidimicrobiales bacterium]|nr:hypothetical protein [Acidimicrobiales bacterium]
MIRAGVVVTAALMAAGCGGGGSETARTVTLLAEDAPSAIVISTTVAPSTTVVPTTAAPTTVEAAKEATSTSAEATSTSAEATASETSLEVEPEPEATTTTTEVVKETIPLAEQDVPAGIKMMDSLEEFNGCLEEEGTTFIGRPDPDLGAENPVNQPEYIEALTLCAARSGIVDAMQEFQMSRIGRSPDQIREANEQFIELAGCLRGKGWTVSDPVPDAEGSLG